MTRHPERDWKTADGDVPHLVIDLQRAPLTHPMKLSAWASWARGEPYHCRVDIPLQSGAVVKHRGRLFPSGRCELDDPRDTMQTDDVHALLHGGKQVAVPKPETKPTGISGSAIYQRVNIYIGDKKIAELKDVTYQPSSAGKAPR